jgi:MFS transporter, PAT family, beta-lactamase induction signal transducer AmpG
VFKNSKWFNSTLKSSNYNLLLVSLFGLINGMGIAFSSNAINYWLASNLVDLEIIGFFSLIILPHSLKYLVSIWIDNYNIPFLKRYGRYKAWLLLSQLVITLAFVALGNLNTSNNLIAIALLGLLISFMAVIQYVILNGNRIQILSHADQGKGNAVYNVGYRLGMFFTGAGVIYLSIIISWAYIFYLLSFCYFILSLLVILFYYENDQYNYEPWIKSKKSILHSIFVEPIKYFSNVREFLLIAIFIFFYQISDSMLMTMLNPFLLTKGFNAEEIASASKFCGLIMVIIGGIAGGVIVDRNCLKKSLIYLGLLHSLGYILFYFIEISSKDLSLLYFVTGFVAFTGGMATTAYLTFTSNLARGIHAKTVYAMLSSITSLAMAVFPCLSGIIVENLSWQIFFIILFIAAIISSSLALIIPKYRYMPS